MMTEVTPLLLTLQSVLDQEGSRTEKAQRVAELIRVSGHYRWVGLYDYLEAEDMLNLIAFSGPAAPAFTSFSAETGLGGSAIHSGSTVMVGDVRLDPRYITTFGNTLSEIVVPIKHPITDHPLGLVDVESECLDAFKPHDRILLEQCAHDLTKLWT